MRRSSNPTVGLSEETPTSVVAAVAPLAGLIAVTRGVAWLVEVVAIVSAVAEAGVETVALAAVAVAVFDTTVELIEKVVAAKAAVVE